MTFRIYKFITCIFFTLYLTQSFVLSFSGGVHLRSTADLIELCRKERQKPFVDLTEEEVSYIKSGAVAADVGRFSLDKIDPRPFETNLFPASDQMEFISKAKKNAKTRAEKLFVFGMELHYWQDEYVPRFSETVFGSKHRTTYLDYARYDKWCLYDCKSEKICTIYLNQKNPSFNFEPIYKVIKNIYNGILCWLINLVQQLLTQYYYSNGNFFELKNCTALLLQTYNELLPKNKKLNNLISLEFINESIDTVVGAHTVLSSIPFIGLSNNEKLNAEKAYNNMQANLMSKIKNYNWEFI